MEIPGEVLLLEIVNLSNRANSEKVSRITGSRTRQHFRVNKMFATSGWTTWPHNERNYREILEILSSRLTSWRIDFIWKIFAAFTGKRRGCFGKVPALRPFWNSFALKSGLRSHIIFVRAGSVSVWGWCVCLVKNQILDSPVLGFPAFRTTRWGLCFGDNFYCFPVNHSLRPHVPKLPKMGQ